MIHDLGCGTGSMGRGLAARLPGPQHWVMHDRDADLLARAAAGMVATAADGAPVTVETRLRDITGLTAADLAGASLVTASALLDMLTAEEVERVVAACVGRPGPVRHLGDRRGSGSTPADPLDAAVAAAFNAHQRRTVDGRRAARPGCGRRHRDAFARRGAHVVVRPSPWRLGPEQPRWPPSGSRAGSGRPVEQRPDLGRTPPRRTAGGVRSGRRGGRPAHESLGRTH